MLYLKGTRIMMFQLSGFYYRVSKVQKPFRVWISGPQTLLFGNLDPLG